MGETVKRYEKFGQEWREQLHCLFAHLGPRFGRVEMQQRALEYLEGLLSPVERKNGWRLAGASRIARWACSCPTPAVAVGRCSTGNCICPNPEQRADDKKRCRAAKVPEEVAFATKPHLAQRMIERAVAAGVPFAWITADEVYGGNRSLRVWLEQQELHFVLAVRSNEYVWPDISGQKTVEQLAATVGPQDWVTLSAGDGAKGPRGYGWTRIALLSWQMAGERWLLLRRSRADGKLAYYVCYAPPGTDWQTLVRIAGTDFAHLCLVVQLQ